MVIGTLRRKQKLRRRRAECPRTALRALRENVDKILDYFVVGKSLANNVSKVEVVDGYNSKPHKAVRCQIQHVKMDRWKRVQKVLIGYLG